jgi:hypothetical protein
VELGWGGVEGDGVEGRRRGEGGGDALEHAGAGNDAIGYTYYCALTTAILTTAHLNMPEPAMKQLAPASAHCAMVQSALTPPSTWQGGNTGG